MPDHSTIKEASHPKKPGEITLSPDLAAQLIKTVDRIESKLDVAVENHSKFKTEVSVELERHRWKHGFYGSLGGFLGGICSVFGIKFSGIG